MIPVYSIQSYNDFKRSHPELDSELDNVIQWYVAEATMKLTDKVNSLDEEMAKLNTQLTQIPNLTKCIIELEKTIKALTAKLSADDLE